MISLELARRLRRAGLRWEPQEGDRFIVPDRGMDDMVFTVSGMTVDVRQVPGGTIIAFNGTVEWALDAVEEWEAVWLPSEHQLRESLGDDVRALVREDARWRCEMRTDGHSWSRSAATASEAYGRALLEVLTARTEAELASLRGRSTTRSRPR